MVAVGSNNVSASTSGPTYALPEPEIRSPRCALLVSGRAWPNPRALQIQIARRWDAAGDQRQLDQAEQSSPGAPTAQRGERPRNRRPCATKSPRHRLDVRARDMTAAAQSGEGSRGPSHRHLGEERQFEVGRRLEVGQAVAVARERGDPHAPALRRPETAGRDIADIAVELSGPRPARRFGFRRRRRPRHAATGWRARPRLQRKVEEPRRHAVTLAGGRSDGLDQPAQMRGGKIRPGGDQSGFRRAVSSCGEPRLDHGGSHAPPERLRPSAARACRLHGSSHRDRHADRRCSARRSGAGTARRRDRAPAMPPEGALSRSALPGSISASWGSQNGKRQSGSATAAAVRPRSAASFRRR